MNVLKISNQALVIKIETLSLEERRITSEVLICLREVESRMLFAELGYSSMYEFCVKHLKYSEGSAYRRIGAMRLLRDLPAESQAMTEAHLKDGTLSVTNLSLIQGFLKTEKKEIGKVYSSEEKLELIQNAQNKSKLTLEKQLAAIQPKIMPTESEGVITAEFTEIRFLADDSLLAKITRVKEFTSNANPRPTYAELLHRLLDDYLNRHDPLLKAQRSTKNQNSASDEALH